MSFALSLMHRMTVHKSRIAA